MGDLQGSNIYNSISDVILSPNSNEMDLKIQNQTENTSTFLALLLKQQRRVKNMYGPNMRHLENWFQHVI